MDVAEGDVGEGPRRRGLGGVTVHRTAAASGGAAARPIDEPVHNGGSIPDAPRAREYETKADNVGHAAGLADVATTCAADVIVLDTKAGGEPMGNDDTMAAAGLIVDGGPPHHMSTESTERINVTLMTRGAAGATRRGREGARR